MSHTLELICCSGVLLFWLAPVLILTICLATGGCAKAAELVRRALRGAGPAPEIK